MSVFSVGEIFVKYSADISSLVSKISDAKSSMSSMASAAVSTGDSFKNLTGAADGGKIVSNVDVAQARLTLIESKAKEARETLQSLQNSANAGEAVTGIPEAEAQLTLLEDKAQQAREALQQLQNPPSEESGNGGESFVSGFKSMAGSVLDFGSKLGQTMFGLQMFTQTAGQLGSALFGPAMQMEQLSTAFTTLDGSAAAAGKEVLQLNTFAAQTPFQTSDIDQAAEKLQGFGVSAQNVIPDLTGIGDALSAMGKTSGGYLDQMTFAFGHIQSEGHLTGRTMMELGQLGINAMGMLELSTGKSKDALQKMITQGTYPANQAIHDLVAGIEKSNMGGGMAKQAMTAAGQLSTLRSNINLALAALAGPLLKVAEGGLSKLGELAASPQFQQFAGTVGQGIATAFTDIANVIGPVASGIGSIVNWFIQGSAPAQMTAVALAAIAGGFAAIQIGAFIAAVPALVAGFIVWGVAAWSAAIATIAATWPIFAIGAAVVIIVAIIILAVKNWGAIAHWLQGIWSAVISWLSGALKAIGAFFVDLWNGIKATTQAAWNWILNAVKVAGIALLVIVLGPIVAIAALFIWLYQHNTYFKQLVDAIINFFRAGFQWMQEQWGKFTGWLKALWDTIASDVKAGWSLISGIFAGVWNTYIAGPLGSVWNSFVAWLSTFIADGLARFQSLWQKVSTLFSSIWSTYIAGPLGKIKQSVIDWFNGLVNTALQSGKNFINMLVQGITSGAGAIWNAVTGIAKNIWSALGFHSPPPAGPAADSDKWMPNFIKMLSSGLTQGAPQIKTASQYVASQMSYPIKPSASSIAVVSASHGASSSPSGQGHTFILEVDGHKLAQITNHATDRTVRLKLGANGRAA